MNFRQVRKKIRTIGNVKQITKAMQMVSSVKMKKAQNEATESRTYRDFLDTIIRKIMSKTELGESTIQRFIKEPTNATRELYIIIASNKGLCGSFNSNLFKKLASHADLDSSDFVVVGKKAGDFLSKMGTTIQADFSSAQPFISSVSAIFSVARDNFLSGKYRRVNLAYNRFISTLQQEPTISQLFPIKKVLQVHEGKQELQSNYLVEPSPEEVFESLFLDYLQGKIRQAILDSEAAEHSSRMMAMKNATDSATDLIFNLTLLRNKLRQTSITNELLDITTAKISSETNEA